MQLLKRLCHYSYTGTVDTCKNCAKCGKSFKIRTNEACNIKIKIKVEVISKIFLLLFVRQYGCLKQRHFTEKKFFKKFHLTSVIENGLGTILTGRIVTETFELESTPKLLTGPNQHLLTLFVKFKMP